MAGNPGLAQNLAAIDEETLASHLSMAWAPEPDLFIRHGWRAAGLAEFFDSKLAYYRAYFTDCYWPDFGSRTQGCRVVPRVSESPFAHQRPGATHPLPIIMFKQRVITAIVLLAVIGLVISASIARRFCFQALAPAQVEGCA